MGPASIVRHIVMSKQTGESTTGDPESKTRSLPPEVTFYLVVNLLLIWFFYAKAMQGIQKDFDPYVRVVIDGQLEWRNPELSWESCLYLGLFVGLVVNAGIQATRLAGILLRSRSR